MITTTDTYEIQIDEKSNGVVIRINGENRCVLRICGIPKELVLDTNGNLRDFIDITYPKNMFSGNLVETMTEQDVNEVKKHIKNKK